MKKYILTFIITALVIGIAAVAGGFIAIKSLRQQANAKGFMHQNGCWRYNPKMDLSNPQQRSLIALVGLFALRESEVLYFVAAEDSEGRPLNTQYNYELVGAAPSARYWSYTLYGEDYFLVKNAENKFGYNLESIEYMDDKDQEFSGKVNKYHRISISKEQAGKNWLPMGKKNQDFRITLRLYNPTPDVYNHLESIELPTIRRMEQ